MKLVKLKSGGIDGRTAVNPEAVSMVRPDGSGTMVFLIGEVEGLNIQEDYEQVVTKLTQP